MMETSLNYYQKQKDEAQAWLDSLRDQLQKSIPIREEIIEQIRVNKEASTTGQMSSFLRSAEAVFVSRFVVPKLFELVSAQVEPADAETAIG